jgi:hypothetical protein
MSPHTADMATAIRFLRDAILLHEKHMKGTAPTTGPAGERSQMQMMQMMKTAYAALTGRSVGHGGM